MVSAEQSSPPLDNVTRTYACAPHRSQRSLAVRGLGDSVVTTGTTSFSRFTSLAYTVLNCCRVLGFPHVEIARFAASDPSPHQGG